MKLNSFAFFLLILLMAVSLNAGAQQKDASKPPKIGLCLSGGGAKGMAHIGLLRMLDSLNIRPDYITGTSMGAVLGALYAIGYSGDDLKTLCLTTNWKALFSDKVSLADIDIEEKDEYGRYLLEIPFVNNKLSLPKGVIEGHVLHEYLTRLTFAVRHIRNFDSLPIPFRCVATDIKTGNAILLTEGSLPEALRSSMAIPMVFSPVEKGEYILVDGGLVRNFPVQEVRDMGATVVLGSYTGFRVLHPDELSDGFKMGLQSISLSMSRQCDADKALCDVLVYNELPGIKASGFENSRIIIEEGEKNARALLPELLKIAAWQHSEGIVSIANKRISDSSSLLPLESLSVDPQNKDIAVLLKREFDIEKGQLYTANDIASGLKQIYGSRFINKVGLDFSLSPDSAASRISIRAYESEHIFLKVGLHYDTDDAAGILLNGTFRNILFANSRALLSLDVAEHPKAHLNYYQLIGPKARFRWTVDFIAANTLLNDFIFTKSSSGQIKTGDKYLRDYFDLALGTNFIIDKSMLLYIEFNHFNDLIKPQRDPRNASTPDPLSFLKEESRGNGIKVGIQQNTLNAVFFPEHGNKMHLEVKTGFGHNSEYVTYEYNEATSTGSEKDVITSHHQTYIRYRLDEQRWQPLSPRLSIGLFASMGAGFSLNNSASVNIADTIEADNPETFYFGGSDVSERTSEIAFTGLRKAELAYSQFFLAGIAAQYRIGNHLFISPSLNAGSFTDSYSALFEHILSWDFDKDINDPNGIDNNDAAQVLGYGLKLGYLSKIGPVNFLVHSNTYTHGWNIYFSFGFKIPY